MPFYYYMVNPVDGGEITQEPSEVSGESTDVVFLHKHSSPKAFHLLLT